MESILSLASGLASALADSETYIRYRKALSNISLDSELNGRLKEYKRVQLNFEMKKLQGIEPPFSDEQYLSKLYAELMLNDTAEEFLLSEREMLLLIKEVNSIVLNECKMDINFFEN